MPERDQLLLAHAAPAHPAVAGKLEIARHDHLAAGIVGDRSTVGLPLQHHTALARLQQGERGAGARRPGAHDYRVERSGARRAGAVRDRSARRHALTQRVADQAHARELTDHEHAARGGLVVLGQLRQRDTVLLGPEHEADGVRAASCRARAMSHTRQRLEHAGDAVDDAEHPFLGTRRHAAARSDAARRVHPRVQADGQLVTCRFQLLSCPGLSRALAARRQQVEHGDQQRDGPDDETQSLHGDLAAIRCNGSASAAGRRELPRRLALLCAANRPTPTRSRLRSPEAARSGCGPGTRVALPLAASGGSP